MLRDLKFHIYDSCTSTQDIAKNFAKDSQKIHVIIAFEQTQGKGTMGKSWTSPKQAGLYLTFAFESANIKDLHTLSHLTACAACLVLERLNPKIRWPNDLFVDMKKIGGILTEIQGKHVYSGLGINLRNSPAFKKIDQPTTYYEAYTPCPDALELAKQISFSYQKLLGEWEKEGFIKIKPIYKKYCLHLNQNVIVDTPSGLLKGILYDISDHGFPILKIGTETQIVSQLGHIHLA